MEKSMFRKTIAVALAASAFAATAAQAHPRLASATPAANTVVVAPTRIQLVFSETLVAQVSGIDLTMTAMPGMNMGPMKVNGVTAAVLQTRLSCRIERYSSHPRYLLVQGQVTEIHSTRANSSHYLELNPSAFPQVQGMPLSAAYNK
jgi:methionine-rich copper-binding protein CopC